MTYFRSRSGERSIYPKEQERIARIFRQVGIENAPRLDRYEGIIVLVNTLKIPAPLSP